MSSYFTLPSFARAKQNKEDLEKTNPQNPVLKDEDEKFLHKQIESEKAAPLAEHTPVAQISDGGAMKAIPKDDQKNPTGANTDQVAVPEAKPEAGDGAQAGKRDNKVEESAEDPPEQAPDDSAENVATTSAKVKKSQKSKGFDLPSQEEAEAATRSFGARNAAAPTGDDGPQRTWTSYLPSVSTTGKKDHATGRKPDTDSAAHPTDDAQHRTWAQYASSYVPSMHSLTSTFRSRDPDAKVEPVYNEDGTINEEATREKQEKEVSVLLDHLNLSSINNRVFAFSGETQKIYERFAQVLKDTMNGAPTAYDDMEKLMRDAGPQLEKQFQAMPPFVQTLVKSLPAKLSSTLGPELMAVASAKPEDDLKRRMQAASAPQKGGSSSTGGSSAAAAPAAQGARGKEEEKHGQGKKKRTMPGLKALVSEQGAVASILRNVVTFLRTRFPFLASTTNVVMSLAVFILMFVFWYCHKRGKEVRLAREAAAKEGEAALEEEEIEVEDDDDGEEPDEEGAEGEAGVETAPLTKQHDSTQAVSGEAAQAHVQTETPAQPEEHKEA